MTTLVAPETLPIPASHRDLLTRPICGVLTPMAADGQPQSSLVWVDFDDECARANTTLERQTGRKLPATPKVSLPGVDRAVAEQLAEAAHGICPYSKAVHGNIEISTNVI